MVVLRQHTFVVTLYTKQPEPDTTVLGEQVQDLLQKNVAGFGGRGKVDAFDAFCEPARRWVFPFNRWGSLARTVLTHRNKGV